MRALLHFRNLDSTQDLNEQLSGFITKGFVSGGQILPVPGQLKVDITHFKMIGQDGMTVVEDSAINRLDVVAGRTNILVLKTQYMPTTDAVMEFQVLDLSAYNALTEGDKAPLSVIGTVTLASGATQVTSMDISYALRNEVTPLSRNSFRGYIDSDASIDATDARPGDFYVVTSGAGDIPAIWSFNGIDFVNITDSVVIASLLNAHRNNLFSNERHMSDAQADAAQGTAGAPSDTNRFVTSQDPRLPTMDEKGALAGFPNTPAPSASNPYITASYYIAQPSELALPVGASTTIQLFPAQGPFYVGMGGVSTVKNYFKFYHVDAGGEPREFTDSVNGQAVEVFKIYKDPGLTQELNPAAEISVLSDYGFWNGSLYITYTGTLAHDPSRLLFGKKVSLSSIDRGFAMKPNPSSAQTSQEAILKMQEISGYKFDETVSVPETNKELGKSVTELIRYLETGTSSSYVIDAKLFAKMRETSFSSQFAADYAETGSQVQPGNLPYAVIQNSAFDVAYTGFDGALTALNTDPDYTAIINYTNPAVNILNVKPGHLFFDQSQKAYRILAVNTTGNGSLLIYTGNEIVAQFTTGGSKVGQVVTNNNPRKLEIVSDFQGYHDNEQFLFEGIEETNQTDGLPPGGIAVGSGATTTMLPQTVLPKMGTTTGANKGRKVYNVYPKKQGNRFDERTVLIGPWKADGTKVLASVGDSAALEYTGKVKELTLWVDKNTDLSGVTAHLFVDGAHAQTRSLGLIAYPHVDVLKNGRKRLPLLFSNVSSDNNVHTTRIEFQGPAGIELPVYGMEVNNTNAGQVELQKGKTHNHLIYNSQDTVFTHTPSTSSATAKKTKYYMDSVNHAVTVVEVTGKEAATSGDVLGFSPITSGTTNFNNPNIGDKLRMGDVMLFVKVDGTNEENFGVKALRRIVNRNFSSNPTQFDLEGPVPFALIPSNSTDLIKQLFTIPVDSEGSPKVQTVSEDVNSQEYARWVLEDLSIGNELDLGDINPFAEDRVTVMADGSTSVAVKQCQKTTTDVSGYDSGVQFVNASSAMTMQVWGSRADIVFAGKNGATTVDISVDGYTYTLPLKGTGVERHTLFFDASCCFHTIQITNASVPTNVVIAEWVLFELKSPAVNGVSLAEVVTQGTGLKTVLNSAVVSTSVLPTLGSRFINFIEEIEVVSQGIGGTKDWSYVLDMALNPVQGYVLTTDRQNAQIKFRVPADVTEVYLYLDVNGSKSRTQVSPASGYCTYTTGIGTHKIYGIAFVQNGIVQKRNLDDKASNHLKFSSVKDLRNFLSITSENVGVTQGSGGEGSTTVSEDNGIGAAVEPLPGFEAIIYDELKLFPNLPQSPVYATFTNAAYNPQTKSYRLKCDKTRLVTVSGTNFTLNAAPNYEIKPGDVIVVGSVARRIATVVTQTSGTLDAGFVGTVSASSCMVSQAVWTKDLTQQGDATQETRPVDIFPGTSVKEIGVTYEDSLALADVTFDKSKAARLAYIASSEGTQLALGFPVSSNFGTWSARPTGAGTLSNYGLPVATNNQRLFLAFFPHPTTVDVVDGANLLYYDVSFYSSVVDISGGAAHSAFAMSDNSSTPQNCTVSVVGGVTVLTLTNWTYTQGAGSGQTMGDIDVLVDGQDCPMEVVGVTPSSEVTWKPVTGRPDQIQFNYNLSVVSKSIQVKKRFGSLDYAPLNRTLLANQLGIVVGTTAMVNAGVASYSSLQAAVTAATAGDVITILNGTTIAENVTVNKRVYIQGKGYDSYLNGSLTIAVGSDYSTVKGLRFNSGSIAASGIQMVECFFTTAPADTGIANYVQGIEV